MNAQFDRFFHWGRWSSWLCLCAILLLCPFQVYPNAHCIIHGSCSEALIDRRFVRRKSERRDEMIKRPLCALLMIWIFVVPSPGLADWTNNPSANTPVYTGSSHQWVQKIVSDGNGGALVIWQEYNGGHPSLYAQRLDRRGLLKWTPSGALVVFGGGGGAWEAQAVSDGSGGAIIVWTYNYNGQMDIYAQKINANGVVQWAEGGVAVSVATGAQTIPQIVSDGSGGAIIAWQDTRNGNADIYAQRINAGGVAQWTANGASVAVLAGEQTFPAMVADGSGGAIIAWLDTRNGNSDIYAQRINASGAGQWTYNGNAVCTDSSHQETLSMAPDGSGGAFIAWQDYRSGKSTIYAQRLNTSGTGQLTANGVVMSTAGSEQYTPYVASDCSGGAIVVWQDNGSSNGMIYAQKLNSGNSLVWTSTGKSASTSTAFKTYPVASCDGNGGAIVVWQQTGTDEDIYAQRIGSGGNNMWPPSGVSVSTAPGNQTERQLLGDGTGGGIIAWSDLRSGNTDVYAQRIMGNSALPMTYDSSVTVALNCPASVTAGAQFNVSVNLSNEDCTAPVSVSRFTKMMMGNAAGTLSGLGISGPVNNVLAKTVPAANCSSWPVVPGTASAFNLTMTAPASWGGKAAQVIIEAVDAQGLSLSSGDCMVPVQ